MADLFAASGGAASDAGRPLADRLRPQSLEDVVGQEHLLGKDGPLMRLVSGGSLPSLLFWGPPGTGKTTIARLLADRTGYRFEQISAIFSGVADLKKVFARARDFRQTGQQTLLFVDEIHRFNRAQQDGFLPYVEDGTITLVGATTENPSFELNAALLSRMQVQVLKRLDDHALETLLTRAEAFMGQALPLDDAADHGVAGHGARTALKAMADGDGRYLLTLVETLYGLDLQENVGAEDLAALLMKRAPHYDKSRDEHYNLISALHKSLRGSDVDAALYWFARMLSGGEDPLYIARRLVRFASEDVGLADPQALPQTLAARETYTQLGSPEGELALAQAVIYLATAPKSNAAYVAYKAAMRVAGETGSLMPPKHILNAPTSLMKDQGYGEGYAYDHDTQLGVSGQNYFPDDMPRAPLYQPKERGFERDLSKRMAFFQKVRDQHAGSHDDES